MSRVTPFQTGFEVDDATLSPGAIFRKKDGSLWEVLPNGDQQALGSGGSVPGFTPVSITDADSPYAATAGKLIVVDASNNNVVINLPAAPAAGAQIAVWLSTDPNGDTVEIVAAGGKTINGAGSITLLLQYDQLVVVYDGAGDWSVFSSGAIGLPTWLMNGVVSPVPGLGNVTPSQKGAVYFDTFHGGIYVATGATSADWVAIGGDTSEAIPGIYVADSDDSVNVQSGADGANSAIFRGDGAFGAAGGIVFPSADPLIAGAWWDNAGTLTKSAG